MLRSESETTDIRYEMKNVDLLYHLMFSIELFSIEKKIWHAWTHYVFRKENIFIPSCMYTRQNIYFWNRWSSGKAQLSYSIRIQCTVNIQGLCTTQNLCFPPKIVKVVWNGCNCGMWWKSEVWEKRTFGTSISHTMSSELCDWQAWLPLARLSVPKVEQLSTESMLFTSEPVERSDKCGQRITRNHWAHISRVSITLVLHIFHRVLETANFEIKYF